MRTNTLLLISALAITPIYSLPIPSRPGQELVRRGPGESPPPARQGLSSTTSSGQNLPPAPQSSGVNQPTAPPSSLNDLRKYLKDHNGQDVVDAYDAHLRTHVGTADTYDELLDFLGQIVDKKSGSNHLRSAWRTPNPPAQQRSRVTTEMPIRVKGPPPAQQLSTASAAPPPDSHPGKSLTSLRPAQQRSRAKSFDSRLGKGLPPAQQRSRAKSALPLGSRPSKGSSTSPTSKPLWQIDLFRAYVANRKDWYLARSVTACYDQYLDKKPEGETVAHASATRKDFREWVKSNRTPGEYSLLRHQFREREIYTNAPEFPWPKYESSSASECETPPKRYRRY